jgi:hypothetical protein
MISGGCRCGAVRYDLQAEPLTVRQCWCRDCQYWACGSATLNLVVRRDALQVRGTTSHYESLADSGRHMRRSFCGVCGTQLFSEARENSETQVVRAGTLDDASRFPPQSIIWTASAPAWASFDPALPTFAGPPS